MTTQRTRMIVEEGDGRGRTPGDEPRRRALSLMEQLHRLGHITRDEYDAAGQLRNLHLLLQPASEGVSSYGNSPGRSDPSRKADRKAKRMTGVEIAADGQIRRGESRSNRSTRWKYEDALFAMTGVVDQDGKKIIDEEAQRLLIKAVLETENPPTQSMLGKARSILKSDKQISAVGATFIKEHLRKLAMHFCLIKGKEVRY